MGTSAGTKAEGSVYYYSQFTTIVSLLLYYDSQFTTVYYYSQFTTIVSLLLFYDSPFTTVYYA